jgi:hypothetical protein
MRTKTKGFSRRRTLRVRHCEERSNPEIFTKLGDFHSQGLAIFYNVWYKDGVERVSTIRTLNQFLLARKSEEGVMYILAEIIWWLLAIFGASIGVAAVMLGLSRNSQNLLAPMAMVIGAGLYSVFPALQHFLSAQAWVMLNEVVWWILLAGIIAVAIAAILLAAKRVLCMSFGFCGRTQAEAA